MGKTLGRPVNYDIDSMCETIEEYTDETFVPILKELTSREHWNYDYVMQLKKTNDKLSQSIKRLLDKKEADLERGGLTGRLSKTIVVFSLKQLGWRDRDAEEDGLSALQMISNAFKYGRGDNGGNG